jgi:hypothetical protein
MGMGIKTKIRNEKKSSVKTARKRKSNVSIRVASI